MFRACHAPSAGAAHAAVHKHRMQCLLDLVREVLQEGLRPQRLRSHNIAGERPQRLVGVECRQSRTRKARWQGRGKGVGTGIEDSHDHVCGADARAVMLVALPLGQLWTVG